MRRLLSSLLLTVGLLAASLAFFALFTANTLLSPERADRIVRTTAASAPLRTYAADTLATALDPTVPSAAQLPLHTALTQAFASPQGTLVLQTFSSSLAHRILTGQGPVAIDASSLAPALPSALRSHAPQMIYTVPDSSLPSLAPLRATLVSWGDFLLPWAITLPLLGVLVARRRDTALRRVGRWLVGISLVQVLLYLALPYVLSLFTSPLARMVADLVRAFSTGVVATLLTLLIAGVACLVLSPLLRPHRG